jgi:hypothetical protein
MTALSLFDVVAREDRGARAGPGAASELARAATQLVSDSLADLQRIRSDEEQLTSSSSEPVCRPDVIRAIWQLYREWADDAEEVLSRAKSVDKSLQGIEQLDDAIGRVLARLSVTPDQTIRGLEQAIRGEIVPAKELRDELRARLRA